MARLGAAGPLAVAAALFPIIGSLVLFANAGAVRNFVLSQGPAGWVIFTIGFAVLSGLTLLPTYAQSGLAGYTFGLALGAPAAVLGCVGGSIIGYVIARAASGERVVAVVESNPKWRAVRDALIGERHSFARTLGMVTLLRLPPNSPFAMTNLVLAAMKVRPSVYILGTLLGIAPRTIIAAWIGVGIKEFSKESWSSAIPPWVFYGGIALGVIIVLLIGQIATRAVERISAAPE
ncbi:hypothetical protein PHYC_02157 [Phycisphaerales bacterium]|nr:hypothetical protein PHYC_02157 [Phycisphaerales bacterium]